MDQAEFLQRIKQTVLAQEPRAEVILYGSRARGDYREDSDWDVLVITEKKLTAKEEFHLLDKIYEVELEYLQPVSTIIVDKDHWKKWAILPLYKNISREGINV